MNYRIEQREHEVAVEISGRLTFNDHAKVRALIEELSNSAPLRQVLDVRQLEFVDSTGMGMLLIAREELAKVAKTLVLYQPQGQVKRVLTVAELDGVITIEN
ncbi:MAG: STAS domain-containing protein [Azospirillaceae bacterium]|nr:STAS domain-containing protein [Azospirillaceae bacterium]